MNSSIFWNFYNSSTEIDFESLMRQLITKNDPTYYQQKMIKNTIVIILYSIIFLISLFGNTFVCYIIFSTRQMRTVTNFYIANLTFSDLLMTLINIPFNTARLLLDDWPFGELLCKCVPFIQANSVYVSTITMCIIGLDRHQALVHPFGKRLSAVIPVKVTIPLIWIVSSLLSVPHAYFNEVVKLFSFRYLTRCRVQFPEPQTTYRQWLTVITFTSQYVIPLSIATVCYCKIAYHIHQRGILGAMTQRQIANNTRSNRKTIKMLIVVLVVFAICWFPLNLYHIIADFGSGPSSSHKFMIYLAVHWLAMSSVVYNPFIYSVRNEYFRKGMKKFFRFIFCRCQKMRRQNSTQENSNTRTSLCPNSKRVEQHQDNHIDDNSFIIDQSIDRSPEKQDAKQSQELRFTKTHRWLMIWKTDSSKETRI